MTEQQLARRYLVVLVVGVSLVLGGAVIADWGHPDWRLGAGLLMSAGYGVLVGAALWEWLRHLRRSAFRRRRPEL